mgnify:CR=1 FL=1
MQLPSRTCFPFPSSGFSTLYGSKWVATGKGIPSLASRERFQYPLRVEVGCNSPGTSKWRATLKCFSTLYGSKWVATAVDALCCACAMRFQYPLRVEVGCNSSIAALGKVPIPVSVPSTGRSGLQLFRAIAMLGYCRSFSTLYGSKWVATKRAGCHKRAVVGFSTLYGSKWVATSDRSERYTTSSRRFSTLYGSKWVATKRGLQTETYDGVSVPSTGRSGLQLQGCFCG